MQALQIQGIKIQALLIAMHLFFDLWNSACFVSKTIVIILLPYRTTCSLIKLERDVGAKPLRDLKSKTKILKLILKCTGNQ